MQIFFVPIIIFLKSVAIVYLVISWNYWASFVLFFQLPHFLSQPAYTNIIFIFYCEFHNTRLKSISWVSIKIMPKCTDSFIRQLKNRAKRQKQNQIAHRNLFFNKLWLRLDTLRQIFMHAFRRCSNKTFN